MTTHRREYHPCRLVTLTGHYLTPNGTLSPDPSRSLVAERWWMEREAAKLNTATVIIRAS